MSFPLPQSDDADLARRARAGEVAAFEELVRRHASAAIGAAGRVTRDRSLAEDAAQEAFWKAFRALPLYREENQFRAWICRIAVRCAIDLLRKRRPEIELKPGAVPHSGASEENRLAQRDLLEYALRRLSPIDREIILSLHSEGHSVEEIGTRLSITQTAVRVRAHRARKKLRRFLLEVL